MNPSLKFYQKAWYSFLSAYRKYNFKLTAFDT